MTDRYLFRGRRIEDGEWVTGFLCDDFLCESDKIYILGIGVKTSQVYPTTVGQCTGLKDKNGTLIFEGDVLRVVRNGTPSQTFIGAVEWDDCQWFGAEDYLSSAVKPEHSPEIIGNIHDTPSLLSEGTEGTAMTDRYLFRGKHIDNGER